MLNKLYSYFFNKANLLRSSISKKEGESPWRVKTFAALYLFAVEIMEDLLKLLILLFKNPYDSFQLFTKQETLPICEYSYSDHKRFKKKVQLFSAAGISSIVAIALILNIILSLVVPGQLPSYAKTVNGGWDDWSLTNLAGDPPSGSAGSIAISPADSAEISGTGTASDLRLKSSSYTATDDGEFSTTGSATMANDGGTGADGALDLSLGSASGGCNGTGLSWSGSTCTIDTSNATYQGTYNFTTINIPAGTTLTATGTVDANGKTGNLVILKATGSVTVAGTINLSGNAGSTSSTGGTGGTGGAGGFSGGNGSGNSVGPASDGKGSGGGNGGGSDLSGGGGGGYGGAGGYSAAGTWNGIYSASKLGGSTYHNNIIGGSGGGGGGWPSGGPVGPGGGGGGGGLVIVSDNQITINSGGTIVAIGANSTHWSGAGSGGLIIISAKIAVSNDGTISANGGVGGIYTGTGAGGGGGGGGRIMLLDSDGVVSGSGTSTVSGGTLSTGCYNEPCGPGSNGVLLSVIGSFYLGTTSSTTITGTSAGASVGLAIPSSGLLTPLTPATVTRGSGPQIIVSPDGTSAYVGDAWNHTINMFNRNASSGLLTPLTPASIAIGNEPRGLAISPDGNSVYVTNSISNNVFMYSRDASGALTPLATPTISAGTTPGSIAISPDGASVYIANNGSNNVSMYSRDASGALTPLATPTISAGTTPGSIAISPDGASVYVKGNSSGTYLFNRSISSGLLFPFSPATFDTGAEAAGRYGGITISPDGNFVYAVNFSNRNIYMFSRDNTPNPSGTFESATIDLGAKGNLSTLDFTSTIPAQSQTICTASTGEGCALKLQVATSDSSSGPWTYYGPDGATGTYFTSSGTAIPSVLSGKQYFRYKAYLATADTAYTPTLDSLTLNYTQYPSSSTATNLKFNAGYTGLTWSSVSWVVSNPADISSSVKVKAQARVAANDTALASATFVGYNGTTTNTDTYFDISGSGQTNCSEAAGKFGDGDATKKTYTCQINQTDTTYLNKADPDKTWLELKLVLEGDIYRTPKIDAARASYAINNEPEICVKLTDDTTCDTTVTSLKKIVEPSPFSYLSVAQDQSDQYGNIIFDAYIRDPDTNTGAAENQGFVYVGIEHTDSSGAFGNATDSVIPPVSPATGYYDATGAAGKGRFATGANITITPKESGFANCELTGWTDYRAGFRYKCPVYTSTPNKYARYTFKWKIGNYNENGVFSGDLQDLALASNFKIRLVTYDGEGANSINGAARSVSNGFTADTKKPAVVVNSTVINAAPATSGSGTIGWLPSVTDDNTMQYKLSDDGATWPASWSNYSSTVLHDFAESTDRTTTLYYRLKDAYGNETAPASVTSLQRPHNLTLIDVSNIKGEDPDFYSYANFISWNLVENPLNRFNSYIVYRCIRDEATNPADYCDEKTNYSIINTGQNTALSTNSFTDYLSSADKEKLIYYRVASKDNNGNISGWLAGGITTSSVYGKANGLLDYGEGGGGSDGEPPKIMTAPSFTNIAQTSANVIWTTDELATGGVFYSKNSTNYNSEKSTLAYQTTGYDATTDPSGRTIALTGLDASSIYNIRLKSVDASGNITICDLATTASQATDSVTGRVTYINQSGYCPSGATESTYQFTTLEKDVTPPVISAVTISDVDHESAKIVWTTDENSDSCVSFDTAAADRTYGSGQCASGQITSHTVTLAGLTASTTYYVKVKSQDVEKNLADKCSLEDNTDCPTITLANANYAFTTTAAPPPEVVVISSGGGGGARGKQDFTAPLISGITVADITDQSATVAWTTDEKSSSFVQYGESENLLNTTGGQLDEVLSHKVVLKGLKPETKYFFKATSVDWAGNIGSSNILNFATEKAPTVEEEISQISGIEAQEKTKEVLEKLEEQIKAQKDDIVDPLQALLDALSPFINEPIIIGESPEIEVDSTTATIKWRTDKKSTSFVALAREDEFNDKASEPYKMIVGNPEDSVKEHKVEITGLLPATKYHYQVRSKALIGDTSQSKDFTFTTKSELPQIVSFLQKKTENEKTAVIYWETSVPTDSVVKYTPYVQGKLDSKQSKIQGKPDMVTGHEITLTNLDPGTIYQIEVSGRDPFANATAKILPDFTTAIDKDAPVISQVRIESAMISGKTPKIQTIVSFRTDEPATSQVSFVEGGEEKFKQLPPNLAFATTHTFVITDFKPASIYRIRVEAIDESGNLAVSRDFTILTPAQSQSIIDIIVKTFENTFGWVKNVRF